MKLFESRNVLDRIEKTGNIFLSPDWRVRVLPQLIINIIGILVGCISLIPLIYILMDGSHVILEQDEDAWLIWITKFLIYLLIPITIYTITVALIYTYTITICHDWEIGKSWKQYMKIAWTRLWGYTWYGLWLILVIGFLGALGGVLYLLFPDMYILLIILISVFGCWFIPSIYAGTPGYIIENSGSISKFFQIFGSTSGRWWRVFGNILLGSVVLSLMASLVQQVLYWSMGITSLFTKIAGLDSSTDIDWTGLTSNLTPDFWIRFILGGVFLVTLNGAQQVFLTMFQYVIWKDIVTDNENTSQEIQ